MVLADIHDIRSYADWMAVLVSGIMPDASYDLHSVTTDAQARVVSFFATFRGTHTGDKGPVKATKKSCESHYVYVIRFDPEKDLIASMSKIWNDNYAFKQLGWAK